MFARIMATVTLLLVVGTLAAFVAAIWLEDERWGPTGFLGFVMCIIAGAITWVALEEW